MHRATFMLPLAAAFLAGVLFPPGAHAQQHNYTPGDIEEGGRLFRINCVGCHGPDGNLVSGIDLGRGKFRTAKTDEDIMRIMQDGVPGTGMPATNVVGARAIAVVAYLRNMSSASTTSSVAGMQGDPQRGRAIFEGKGACNSCHRVHGAGSLSGPDLSDVGLARRPIEMETSILAPGTVIAAQNRPYRVVKRDGTVVEGTLLNRDAFTLQLRDSQGRLASFQRSDLREDQFLNQSSMPSYKEKLSPQELADILAYLVTLKGADIQ